jgi:hypothetical protein
VLEDVALLSTRHGAHPNPKSEFRCNLGDRSEGNPETLRTLDGSVRKPGRGYGHDLIKIESVATPDKLLDPLSGSATVARTIPALDQPGNIRRAKLAPDLYVELRNLDAVIVIYARILCDGPPCSPVRKENYQAVA